MAVDPKSPDSVAQRPLGASGTTVSCLGIGCASFWARPGFAEQRARAVLQTALELGITVFDTGASYAAGHAEQRLGRLLRELRVEPDSLLIGTKVGTVIDDRGRLKKDFRPDSIVRQFEHSLKRLETDRIALLQLHGPEPGDLTEELLLTLERLRQQGKVQLLGVNAHDRVIRECIGRSPFAVLMPFISLLEPDRQQLGLQAAEAGQAVLAAGPLARMLFAPPLSRWLFEPRGLWYLARALRHPRSIPWQQLRALRSILNHDGWTPAQLALAWVLEQPGISCAVFGTTRPEHVIELAEISRRPLPSSVRVELAAFLANPSESGA